MSLQESNEINTSLNTQINLSNGEIITFPLFYYLYIEKKGPFYQTAREAWFEFHSILLKYNKIKNKSIYMSGLSYINEEKDENDINKYIYQAGLFYSYDISKDNNPNTPSNNPDNTPTTTPPPTPPPTPPTPTTTTIITNDDNNNNDNIKIPEELLLRQINYTKFFKVILTGSYSQLPDAYPEAFKKLNEWNLIQNKNEFCMEIYLNTPENTEENELKTEIYIPIL